MENQNEEKGISLADIFKKVWKGKIVGIITFVVLAILSSIALIIIGINSKTYNFIFQYDQVPGLDEDRYLDGTAFNYHNLVQEEAVDKVISENPEFKSVDKSKFYNGNKFRIGKEYTYRMITEDDFEVLSINYVIEMPQSAFKSERQAKNFAIALASLPLTKTNEMVDKLRYDSHLKAYEGAQTYTSRIDYVNAQVAILKDGYDKLIEENTDCEVLVGDEMHKLSALLNDLNTYVNERNLDTMNTEVKLNGYVYSDVEKAQIQMVYDDLVYEHKYLAGDGLTIKGELGTLQQQLDDLTATYGSGSTTQIIATEAFNTLSVKIADVNAKILENEKQQAILKNKLDTYALADQSASQAFSARLDSIKAKLVEFTNIYTDVSKQLTNRNMNVYYTNSNVIKSTGGVNIMFLAAAVVVSLVVGCGVALCVGIYKGKKESALVEAQETVSE